MKKKKWLIIIPLVIILLILGGTIIWRSLSDESNLTSEERTWINNSFNNVQNVYVVKDENIFSKGDNGVFYTFLDDFSKEYGININIVNSEAGVTGAGVSLNYTHEEAENAKVFATDHYVLLSKNNEYFNQNSDLNGLSIGVLNVDKDFISSYLKDENVTLNGYDTIEDLIKSMDGKETYIILPRMKYLDQILSHNFNMVYHLSDVNNYYALTGVGDINII